LRIQLNLTQSKSHKNHAETQFKILEYQLHEGLLVKLLKFSGIFSAIAPFYLLASPPIENKVVYVGVNSNNSVFVQFEQIINEPGCQSNQLVIDKDNPIADRVMSVALSAKATNSTVVIKTKGCIRNSPSMKEDESDWGWFYVQ